MKVLQIQLIDKVKGVSVSSILLYWWIAYNNHMTDLPIRLNNSELFFKDVVASFDILIE